MCNANCIFNIYLYGNSGTRTLLKFAHFINQFGPCLQWPWSKLTDVPELTDELVQTIADQSDAQSGQHSIRELERIRDDNLVSIMRGLKTQDWGAGELLNQVDKELTVLFEQETDGLLKTNQRMEPVDWTDYNGHMNESRYGQIWSDAADAVMAHVGADAGYVAGGLSYFTVETKTRFLLEAHAGEAVRCETRVTTGEGKKLGLAHAMVRNSDGEVLATCEQFLVHVSLETRKSCHPSPDVLARVEALLAAHSG